MCIDTSLDLLFCAMNAIHTDCYVVPISRFAFLRNECNSHRLLSFHAGGLPAERQPARRSCTYLLTHPVCPCRAAVRCRWGSESSWRHVFQNSHAGPWTCRHRREHARLCISGAGSAATATTSAISCLLHGATRIHMRHDGQEPRPTAQFCLAPATSKSSSSSSKIRHTSPSVTLSRRRCTPSKRHCTST